MSYLVLVIILSAVVYRVSRFIILDSLVDGTRDRFADFLERHPGLFWTKIGELMRCPYCITIWVAAGAVWAQHVFVSPIPVPIWTWLAVATGSVVFWGIIDSEET